MIAYANPAQQAKPAPAWRHALRQKVAGWLYRYLPAEVLGTTCALLGASLTFALTGNSAVAALVAASAENIGFYGRLLARDLAGTATLRGCLRALRDIALEFGPAEALDSLLRPALMCAGTALLPDLHAAVIAGKLLADMVFYMLAIAAHELQMNHLHGKEVPARSNT